MKTITIGRGEGCNIYIDDESMSRRHAIIKIPTFGGMEIVDMSKNGTFVNGVRLRPNVPVPVTRKDKVNFADVQILDWSLIPDPLKYYKIGAAIVGGIIALILLIFLIKSIFSGSSEDSATPPSVEQVLKPVPSSEQHVESTKDEPAQEAVEDEAEPQAPATTEGKETSAETYDPVKEFNKAVQAGKDKREAEERARKQKAKEQQQQKQKPQESQKPAETQTPAKEKEKSPSSDNKKKTVVI